MACPLLCTYAQERYLHKLQKLRQVTFNDLWPLPERFKLRTAYGELKFNKNESYFVIRAIFRMMWRPMIPVYTVGLLLQFLPLLRIKLNSSIMHNVDDLSNYSMYMIVADVARIMIVQLLNNQQNIAQQYIKNEMSRAQNAFNIEMFRMPLQSAGDLVAIVGKTGAGKSSLLLAMCSEVEMTQGTGRLVGKIACLEQQPWIMNDTLRANILFGREYDEEYYWKVLSACGLTDDLEMWPKSDMTIIGENGMNISGGQRARLALARTVYSKADIYFLDDPLSAVDAIVKRHILDNIILSTGLLGDKLRFVTTNADNILPLCNQIATVDNGRVLVKVQTPQVHTTFEFKAQTKPIQKDVGNGSKELQATPASEGKHIVSTTDESNDLIASTSDTSKPPKQWSHWSNALYAIRICGFPVVATIIMTVLFDKISALVLDMYKLDVLRANSNPSTTDSNYEHSKSLVDNGAQMIRLFGVEPYFTNKYIKSAENKTRLAMVWSAYGDLKILVSSATKTALHSILLYVYIALSKVGLYTIRAGDVAEFRENCSMKYGADLGYALKNVNLTINPGEKIGIVGRTGAGKSSLAKVLFRLVHENTSGSILIDGQDISEFGVGDYRPRLGMIPQESTMLDGASSGQQQLFSICRVIMRKRRIIVLDEATANVDLETDKSVQELIRKELSDCTVLTIAHRLDTIMNSDRIIVMDKGTIAEIGTPQELLAKDGMFAQLVKTSDFGQ
ncbi:ABC transporter C member 13 [Coemansia sp. S3946]|nr:ABC transporter C member 13 [Coemansia sp. S3946]